MHSVSPVRLSYGISFSLSFMLMPTDPPVAWKNEPCGRWSSTVAPAFVIAAPHTGLTPAASTVWANDADAIVAPAVVEAAAADMRIPESGAIVDFLDYESVVQVPVRSFLELFEGFGGEVDIFRGDYLLAGFLVDGVPGSHIQPCRQVLVGGDAFPVFPQLHEAELRDVFGKYPVFQDGPGISVYHTCILVV